MRVQPKAQEMEDVMEIVLPVPLGVEIYGQDSEEDFQLKWSAGEIEMGNVRELREFRLKLEGLKNIR